MRRSTTWNGHGWTTLGKAEDIGICGIDAETNWRWTSSKDSCVGDIESAAEEYGGTCWNCEAVLSSSTIWFIWWSIWNNKY